jgi:hypothetical protein
MNELSGPATIMTLPNEMLSYTFEFLDALSLAQTQAVCQTFNCIGSQYFFWRNILTKTPRDNPNFVASLSDEYKHDPSRAFSSKYGKRVALKKLACELESLYRLEKQEPKIKVWGIPKYRQALSLIAPSLTASYKSGLGLYTMIIADELCIYFRKNGNIEARNRFSGKLISEFQNDASRCRLKFYQRKIVSISEKKINVFDIDQRKTLLSIPIECRNFFKSQIVNNKIFIITNLFQLKIFDINDGRELPLPENIQPNKKISFFGIFHNQLLTGHKRSITLSKIGDNFNSEDNIESQTIHLSSVEKGRIVSLYVIDQYVIAKVKIKLKFQFINVDIKTGLVKHIIDRYYIEPTRIDDKFLTLVSGYRSDEPAVTLIDQNGDFHTLPLKNRVVDWAIAKNIFGVGLKNGTIELYDLKSFSLIRRLESDTKSTITCIRIIGNKIYSGHENGKVRRWTF